MECGDGGMLCEEKGNVLHLEDIVAQTYLSQFFPFKMDWSKMAGRSAYW